MDRPALATNFLEADSNDSELRIFHPNNSDLIYMNNGTVEMNLFTIDTSSETLYLWVYLFLCLAGIIETIISVIVLTRPSMRTTSASMNILLAVLESANLIFLLIYSQSVILRLAFIKYILRPWFINWFRVLACMCIPFMIFFNWITLAISMWKIVAITWPFRAKTLLTTKRVTIVVICIAVLSLLLSMHMFLFTKLSGEYIRPNQKAKMFGALYNTTKRVYRDQLNMFKRLRLTAYIVGYVCPFISSIVAIVYLIFSLCKAKRNQLRMTEGQSTTGKRETKATLMIVVLLIAFLLSYANPVLFVIQQYLEPGKSTILPLCLNMCLPVLVINNLTIFIYYLMSAKFRKTFRKIFYFPLHSGKQKKLGV